MVLERSAARHLSQARRRWCFASSPWPFWSLPGQAHCPAPTNQPLPPQPHATQHIHHSPRHLFLNIPHQNVQKQLRQRFRYLVISLSCLSIDCANSVREFDSSPQGRIFQVEYALEAIKQGSVAVGLVSKTHAVLVALKVQLMMMERGVGLMEVGC